MFYSDISYCYVAYKYAEIGPGMIYNEVLINLYSWRAFNAAWTVM